MGGSTADTPTTPDFLRVSDAERDHAVNELRSEFVDGRLSHETFVYRMQTALAARNQGQLAGLFTDLPPRRARLLARIRVALQGLGASPRPERPERPRRPEQAYPTRTPRAGSRQVRDTPWTDGPQPGPAAGQGSRDIQAARFSGPGQPSPQFGAFGHGYAPGHDGVPDPGHDGGPSHDGAPGHDGSAWPAPLVFPPGRGSRFTIGRTRDCDLCLTDLSVSRLHAELVRGDDGWLLTDLGSHNGTRVNGWLVRETVQVRPGDRVEFGSAVFVIQGDPQEPAPSG
jgi:hypothetical protein